MQVFSFAEDITSPFAGRGREGVAPVGGKRLPLPARSIALSARAAGNCRAISAVAWMAKIRRDVSPTSSCLRALTGLKVTGTSNKVKKIPGDNILYGLDTCRVSRPADPPTPAADEAQARMFTINFVDTNQEAIDAGTESDSKRNNLTLSLAMVPKSQGGPGLFVSAGGGVDRAWKLSDHWYLTESCRPTARSAR